MSAPAAAQALSADLCRFLSFAQLDNQHGSAALTVMGANGQPSAEGDEQPTSSTGTTSEEDDPNDAADGEPTAWMARQAERVVQLAPARGQLPIRDNVLARDHHSLDPRPPRA